MSVNFNNILGVLRKIFSGMTSRADKVSENVFSGEIGFFDSLFKDHKHPLLRGDVMAYAEVRWPKNAYPELWDEVPEDLVREGLTRDRLLDGSRPGAILAPTSINKELIKDASAEAKKSAIKTFIVITSAALLLSAAALLVTRMPAESKIDDPVAQQSYYLSSHQDKDFWSRDEISSVASRSAAIDTVVSGAEAIAKGSVIFSVSAIFALLLGVFAAAAVWVGKFRALVFRAAVQASRHLRVETKASTVWFKDDMDSSLDDRKAYRKQLAAAKRDKSSLITFGRATGKFKFRGVLNSPSRDQICAQTINDKMQGVFVNGGTGGGKSFSFAMPTAASIISRMDYEDISLFVADGQGSLADDVSEVAKKFGRECQIIGIGEGEWGVDLCDGITPALAAGIIKSVMVQLGGAGSNDVIWKNMAAYVIQLSLIIARAWERTEGGIRFAEETGERPYSYAVARRIAEEMAGGPDSLPSIIIKDIIAMKDAEYFSDIADLWNEELFGAIRYLRGQYLNLAEGTRTSVEFNITEALCGFDGPLRDRFASGKDGKFAIRDIWGSKITCVRIPSTMLGPAAKIVLVAIKTLVYNEAMRRWHQNHDIRFLQMLALLFDEFPTIATADIAAMSDANFPNECRKTGTFFAGVATQGIAPLVQAIGREAAWNFINNMRTKFMLPIEEQETFEYIESIVGDGPRSRITEDRDFESLEALGLECGINPYIPQQARIEDAGNVGIFASLSAAGKPLNYPVLDKKFTPSDFYYQSTTGESGSNQSSFVNAVFKAHDENKAFMADGNERRKVFTGAELVKLGQGFAWASWMRAGYMMTDVVELEGANLVLERLLDEHKRNKIAEAVLADPTQYDDDRKEAVVA